MSVTIAMPRMSTDPELTTAQSKYVESLARAGAEVHWVALSDSDAAVTEALTCDGLLLPGGGDMDPAFYGQERIPACGEPNLLRDAAEPKLLRAFLAGRLAPDIQRSLEIALTTESGGIEHCTVMGVPDEAEQLMLHLISNALRACDAGGRVWVSLKQKKTGVVLRVEDNGCGLMEEDPIENNRRFLSGAKLGLRICKLICRRAGWKLTLTARPGGGTRAQVVFPLASCEDIPPEMELHSSEENDIRAARFASRAAQELLLLRRY